MTNRTVLWEGKENEKKTVVQHKLIVQSICCRTNGLYFDPRGRAQSRLAVLTIFMQVVRPSVRPSVRPYASHKASKSSENHCRLWLWAGWVDHWWLLSCFICLFVCVIIANLRMNECIRCIPFIISYFIKVCTTRYDFFHAYEAKIKVCISLKIGRY